MTIGYRLKELKNLNIFSVNDLSELLKCEQPTISNYFNDKRAISTQSLELITDRYNINLNWLITGKGKMFLSDAPQVPASEHQKKITELEKEIEKLKKEIAYRNSIADEIAALKKENAKLDQENRALTAELLEKLRRLADFAPNPKLVKT